MSAPDRASPMAGALAPGRHGASDGGAVAIVERRYDLVQISARRGRAADVAAAMQSAFALALPGPRRSARSGDVMALWLQPDGWLLVAPRGPEGALARAAKSAAGAAGSIVDQSHGRSVIGLSGVRAAWVLNKLCRLDLHPRAAGPGFVAATPVAELACVVHQLDAVPSYDLIVFSTFVRSFVASLTHAAEEVGFTFKPSG